MKKYTNQELSAGSELAAAAIRLIILCSATEKERYTPGAQRAAIVIMLDCFGVGGEGVDAMSVADWEELMAQVMARKSEIEARKSAGLS